VEGRDTRYAPKDGWDAGIMPLPGGAFSSGLSAISAWVVSIKPATDPAFCSALRTTLVGSITPTLSSFS
jgi:hypothetical protein